MSIHRPPLDRGSVAADTRGRPSGNPKLPVKAVAVCVLFLGILSYAHSLTSPREWVPMSDFERDIVGARAAEVGVNPYQTLGELEGQVPDLEVDPSMSNQWVAHSPVSLAIARVVWASAGDASDEWARSLVVLATLGMAAGIIAHGSRTGFDPPWWVLAAALLLSLGAVTDALWVQGASIVAVLLTGVLWARRTGRFWLSTALLGIVVGWRPWCAPLALFLPYERRPLRDTLWTGIAAVCFTSLALPLVGGWGALIQWATKAMPENLAQHIRNEWNLAITDSLWPVAAPFVVVAFIWLGVLWRNRATTKSGQLGALATLGLLPLVWSHYWVAVLPFLVPDRDSPPAAPLTLSLGFLSMSVPVIGHSGTTARIAGLVALVFLAISIALQPPEEAQQRTIRSSSSSLPSMPST